MTTPARRAIAIFVPLAVLLTAVCGLVYVAVQQDLRSGANDPQIQLAEDAAVQLDAGARPATLVGPTTVDIARSLAPFIAIDDAAGAVIATDGSLDGALPAPPAGVLAAAQASGRNVVTWQPQAGVRVALVVVPWHGGSVLAGRSLRLVEERESQILALVLAALLASLLVLAVASFVAARFWPADGPATRG